MAAPNKPVTYYKREIDKLWLRTNMDTLDIARKLSIPECLVYNIIARATSKTEPARRRFTTLERAA